MTWGNGNGRRKSRAASWPVELSIETAIDLVVEGQNGDPFRIAVCSPVCFHRSWE